MVRAVWDARYAASFLSLGDGGDLSPRKVQSIRTQVESMEGLCDGEKVPVK